MHPSFPKTRPEFHPKHTLIAPYLPKLTFLHTSIHNTTLGTSSVSLWLRNHNVGGLHMV